MKESDRSVLKNRGRLANGPIFNAVTRRAKAFNKFDYFDRAIILQGRCIRCRPPGLNRLGFRASKSIMDFWLETALALILVKSCKLDSVSCQSPDRWRAFCHSEDRRATKATTAKGLIGHFNANADFLQHNGTTAVVA